MVPHDAPIVTPAGAHCPPLQLPLAQSPFEEHAPQSATLHVFVPGQVPPHPSEQLEPPQVEEAQEQSREQKTTLKLAEPPQPATEPTAPLPETAPGALIV